MLRCRTHPLVDQLAAEDSAPTRRRRPHPSPLTEQDRDTSDATRRARDPTTPHDMEEDQAVDDDVTAALNHRADVAKRCGPRAASPSLTEEIHDGT